ncbi:spore gernimation protein [Bacillus sp. AFS026049]|uniref:Ger(x)C family spore germination protein n=1 Tax=Peribacillus frigoritolerans TaxID=450367 RepID=UPI000BECE939|nr:Ger(x)C family spore germination protein [Peribacillus frigoritolerans]MCR8869161.1 Ger(x)C family spore germination protein [Peribacillus frigoritolerans]PEF39834.1 spore gernimation protein [Bacillus sp. AFS094228]PEO50451.1 spore gernimation protein [Bacillus sp. AFS026049]
MRKLFLVILAFPLLCSCAQPRVVDEVNMSQAIGYDILKNDNVEGFFVIPIFQQDKMGKYQILTGTSTTTSDVQAIVSKKTDKPVLLGQTRIILFSEKMVREIGMTELTDYLYREPQLGNRVILAVVEGKTKDVINTKPPNTNVNIGIFLSDLINQQNETGNGPDTNLHLFLGNALEAGGDSYLPLIKLINNEVAVSGVALFHENKMVTKVRTGDMFIFKTLVQNHRRGIYKFKLKDKKKSDIVVESIRSGSSYEVSKSESSPSITIKLKIKGQIKESMRSENLTNRKMIKKIEQAMEDDLTKQANRLIKDFQKKSLDPIGLKEKYHAKNKKLTYEHWKKIYPTMDINIETKVNIIQTGVSE